MGLTSLTILISLLSPAFVEEWIVLSEVHTLRLVQGTVEYPDGSPAEGVVVELYDNPDVILEHESGWQDKQNKIESVTTDKDGKFKFSKVSPGKYEVRVKLDPGTGANQTSVIVRVRRFWFWPLGRSLRIQYSTLM